MGYLVFGGNAMTARDWLGILPNSVNEKSWADVAFVLVDYPGFGASSGSPSVQSIMHAAAQSLTAATDSIDGSFEQEARQEDLVVGVIGHSIGCAAALHFAAAQLETPTPVEHLILSAPFTTLPAMAHEMLPVLKILPQELIAMLTARQGWNNLAAADRMALRKDIVTLPRIHMAHGSADSIVPHAMGVELSSHLKSHGFSVDFVSMEGLNHNDLFSAPDYAEWLQSALA